MVNSKDDEKKRKNIKEAKELLEKLKKEINKSKLPLKKKKQGISILKKGMMPRPKWLGARYGFKKNNI